jgi:hypothetical protein
VARRLCTRLSACVIRSGRRPSADYAAVPARPDRRRFPLTPPDLGREVGMAGRSLTSRLDQIVRCEVLGPFEDSAPKIEYSALRHAPETSVAGHGSHGGDDRSDQSRSAGAPGQVAGADTRPSVMCPMFAWSRHDRGNRPEAGSRSRSVWSTATILPGSPSAARSPSRSSSWTG